MVSLGENTDYSLTKRNPLTLLYLFYRANRALHYARKQGILGIDFADYGRRLGLRLLCRVVPGGISLLLRPVSITRYFEFDFALSALPSNLGSCLDASSPRLFSFYALEHRSPRSLLMINPDIEDLEFSRVLAAKLSLTNIEFAGRAVDQLQSERKYDCIWSLSVLEHIAEPYDDTVAIQFLYEALRPGGRLIVTVPTDKQFRCEFRVRDHYGMGNEREDGSYFFQRFYDEQAIYDRLLTHISAKPTTLRWFGERSPGHFNKYISRWLKYKLRVTVDDPREIADHYQEFACWDEMPGVGVCGIIIDKPS